MSLISPNLDDTNFDQLLKKALDFIKAKSPEWTDHGASDPGVVLLEAFAYLTDGLHYRTNQIPRKLYIEFLKLIGVKLAAPAAASVELTFMAAASNQRRVLVPAATRVTSSRAGSSEPVVFTTAVDAWIEPGTSEASVLAHHTSSVLGELIGIGTGAAGLGLRVSRPPIVADRRDLATLQVGVEVKSLEELKGGEKVSHGERAFRVWREVEHFTFPIESRHGYLVDRVSGLITFAPAVQGDGELGEIPAAGREIRAWYHHGGGAAGNVVAGTLDRIKDGPIADVVGVRQVQDATGGRAGGSIEDALIRGPAELHSLRRAVTARDFEAVVMREPGGIAHVKAFTQRELWKHARPGTVDVVVVPDVELAERGESHENVTADKLKKKATEPERDRVQRLLDDRHPLGITCNVRYALYKSVSVTAEVSIASIENIETIRKRLLGRIYRALSPLDGEGRTARGFGGVLRKGDIYGVLSRDAAVQYVGRVSLSLDLAPEDVRALVSDPLQPGTWYAACANGLFRSTNAAKSWEQVFPATQKVERVIVHPDLPGLIAIATGGGQGEPTQIHVSRDCGETWCKETRKLEAGISDLAWTTRDGDPWLLVASVRGGLFELWIKLFDDPIPQIRFHTELQTVTVDARPERKDLCARCLVAGLDSSGVPLVAVAAIPPKDGDIYGIYLSAEGGASGTFRDIGLMKIDIRVLELQRDGGQTFLWAAAVAAGYTDGTGCFRMQMDGTSPPKSRWQEVRKDWTGGSVNALAFHGKRVFAASFQRGVCVWDSTLPEPAWRASELGCGLPENNERRLFDEVLAVGVDASGSRLENPLVLAGGKHGVFQRDQVQDQGEQRERYVPASPRLVDDVALPRDWVICSGKHTLLEPQ
jgi:Baseplate J-like protein